MRLGTLCALSVIADAVFVWPPSAGADEPQDEYGRLLLETERALLTGVEALGGDETVFATVMRLGGIYGPGRDLEARIRSLAGAVWDRLSPAVPQQTLGLILTNGRRPGTLGTTRDDA